MKLDAIKMNEIPVEYRPLLHPNKATAQGIIEMFVEVLPLNISKVMKPIKIEPPPPEEFELRLIIWETKDLLFGGKGKDVFFKVFYDPEGYLSEDQVKETDTHFNCKNGIAKFNWRMKFNLTLPCTFPRLNIAAMDYNILSSSEALGVSYISLKRIFYRLRQEGKTEITKKWIPLVSSKDPADQKGEVLISLYMLQKYEAEQYPVGESWDEPNRNPRLEKPTEGRDIFDFLAGLVDLGGFNWNFDMFFWIKILGVVGVLLLLLLVLAQFIV